MMLQNKILLFLQECAAEKMQDQEFLPPACDHERRASPRAMGRWCFPRAEAELSLDRNQGLATCWLVFA